MPKMIGLTGLEWKEAKRRWTTQTHLCAKSIFTSFLQLLVKNKWTGVLLLFSCHVVSSSWQPEGLQQTSLPSPFTISQCLPKLMSIEPVMPSNHLILCLPLLPSVFPSISVFPNQSVRIRWPKYWSFHISPSKDYSGLISFRIDWFDHCCPRDTQESSPAPQHQFFGALPSLWSSSNIHTWLLERP